MKECVCDKCRTACVHHPGWYMPGEAEKTAAALGMELKDFFDLYLVVDYWIGDQGNIYVLMPATKQYPAGSVVPFDPDGECVFFRNQRCNIHDNKPFECSLYMHSDTRDEVRQRHEDVAKAWDTPEHQAKIVQLLGHDPEPPEFNFGDVLSILFRG